MCQKELVKFLFILDQYEFIVLFRLFFWHSFVKYYILKITFFRKLCHVTVVNLYPPRRRQKDEDKAIEFTRRQLQFSYGAETDRNIHTSDCLHILRGSRAEFPYVIVHFNQRHCPIQVDQLVPVPRPLVTLWDCDFAHIITADFLADNCVSLWGKHACGPRFPLPCRRPDSTSR